MKTNYDARAALIAMAGLLGGCAKLSGEAAAPFTIDVLAVTDSGYPLRGVEIVATEKVVVTTDANGRATVTASGVPGDRRAFTVRCPARYVKPSPLTITLGAGSGDRRPHEVTCVPAKRTVVVAARLDGAPQLSLFHRGKEVARTDRSGAAHFELDVTPGEAFGILVATADDDGSLVPRDPTIIFTPGPKDDLVLLEQRFTRK